MEETKNPGQHPIFGWGRVVLTRDEDWLDCMLLNYFLDLHVGALVASTDTVHKFEVGYLVICNRVHSSDLSDVDRFVNERCVALWLFRFPVDGGVTRHGPDHKFTDCKSCEDECELSKSALELWTSLISFLLSGSRLLLRGWFWFSATLSLHWSLLVLSLTHINFIIF